MAFGDRDLPALFRELAVPVTLGAATTRGILDDVEEIELQGSVVGLQEGMVAVTLRTGALPGLQVGSSITVDGTPRVVRERLRVGDGRLTRLVCE